MGTTATAQRQSTALLFGLIVRDALLTILILTTWNWINAWQIESPSTLSWLLAGITGLVSGWIISRFLHEWGHYFPAKLLGATCPLYSISKVGKIFEYEMDKNNETQFAALSWGGTLTHWFIALFLFYFLDGNSPAVVGIQAGAFGYVATATVVEFPVMIRHAMGQPSRDAYSFDRKFIIQLDRTKTLRLGGLTGMLTIILYAWFML